AEDGIREFHVTGVQTCALPISLEVVGAAAAIDRILAIPCFDVVGTFATENYFTGLCAENHVIAVTAIKSAFRIRFGDDEIIAARSEERRGGKGGRGGEGPRWEG